jgi:hypothetical protein
LLDQRHGGDGGVEHQHRDRQAIVRAQAHADFGKTSRRWARSRIAEALRSLVTSTAYGR